MASISDPIAPCQTMKVMTYNVNFSRSVDGENAQSELQRFSWSNREPYVVDVIKNESPDVAFIQEVYHKFSDNFLANFTEEYGYVAARVNSRPEKGSRFGACCNITLYKKSLIGSDSPKSFQFNFKKDSSLDETVENVSGVVIGNLRIINVHFPMSLQGRMDMANHFHRCLGKESHLIIAGDFNSFCNWGGPTQLSIMGSKVSGIDYEEDETVAETDKLKHFAKRLVQSNSDQELSQEEIIKISQRVFYSNGALSSKSGQIATNSFFAYPYDVYHTFSEQRIQEIEAAKEKVGTWATLDHILGRGFKIVEGTQPMVLDHLQMEDGEAPSDHCPVTVVLEPIRSS